VIQTHEHNGDFKEPRAGVLGEALLIYRFKTDGRVGGTIGREAEEGVISFSGIAERITSVRRGIDRLRVLCFASIQTRQLELKCEKLRNSRFHGHDSAPFVAHNNHK
jgi:hypothetical protein